MAEKNLRPPRQQRSIEKREHIKRTALELFSTVGYHKTTTNEIARQAGIPVGSFYTYFQDKTALYEELVKDMYENVLSQVMDTGLSDGDGPACLIRRYVEIVMRGHSYMPAFQREVASLSLQYDAFRALENKYRTPSFQQMSTLLDRYRPYLRITDLETAGFILQTGIEAIVHEVQFFPNGYDKERVIQELTDLLCRYMIREDCLPQLQDGE